jgi:hypothetical protein
MIILYAAYLLLLSLFFHCGYPRFHSHDPHLVVVPAPVLNRKQHEVGVTTMDTYMTGHTKSRNSVFLTYIN